MSTQLDAQLYGVDMFGHSLRSPVQSPIARKFLVPPFSVLNAREGDWQERKRAWVAMGILPEARNVTGKNCTTGKNSCMLKAVEGSPHLHPINGEEGGGVVSLFDPVLCELAYHWFSREGAQVIDPFAGGSVRGIVAAHLGRKYWGCDLRAEQIEANRAQGTALCEGKPAPEWVCGDSMNEVENAPVADFLFSCPPYGDLERYSNLPQDLSAMPWADFRVAYRIIINRACKRLRNNRFACFVVGDFRDGKGNYRNFVSETISAFLDAGLALYNEAILVTSVGSASMRVMRQFNSGRKLCKTHQNVLVFVKGDGCAAANRIMQGVASDFVTVSFLTASRQSHESRRNDE